MKDNNNIEIRKAEVRADEATGRLVSGYAVRFESESLNMGFVEIIHRGAITDETIAQSDVFALLNHNENTVLARSNHGTGSLKLSVDNDGLFYEFEAPQTTHGDELLEHIKRAEISQSSFAFSVSPEDGAEKWTKRKDGVIQRDIYKIARLYDISPVYQPAYTETTCSKRALDKIDELTQQLENEQSEIEMLKSRIAELEAQLEKKDSETTETNDEVQTDEKDDETRTESEDEKDDEKDTENVSENSEINNKTMPENESEPDDKTDTPTDNETTGSDDEETEPEPEQDKNNKRNITNMENFSLTKELRKAIADGTNKIDFRAYTVNDEGADLVQTDVLDIWKPLRAKNVLTEAGVRVLSGIKNNARIPVASATTAKFGGEVANASDGSGAFTSAVLTPKRVCAKVPVSLELIMQNDSVDSFIVEDLQNAMYSAVEDKVFGKQAESTDVYAGLLNGVPNASIYDVSTFNALTTLEAAVETNGANPANCKYVVSPTGKAHLRSMPKSAKTTELTMQNGEIDGTPVLSTGHLNDSSINLVYGDFTQCVLGLYDTFTVDICRDSTSLSNGTVTLVANGYVDFKCVRPETFKFGKA